jgi:SAM-dependent methyltransferase
MTSEKLSDISEVENAFAVDDYLYFHADYLPPERSEAETEAAVLMLNMAPPMRVLDLACGFGRIANRLAARGHRVTGVEVLAGFLEIARAQARQTGVTVEYVQGDMRRIEYRAQFDRVVLMFNSFGYFTDSENLLVMQKIARALKPGGKVGFDIANRDGVLNNFHSHYVTEKDGNLLINRFSFDVWSGRLFNERVVIRGGVRTDRPFSIRLYSLTEIRALLSQAGLVLEQAYGEWDGQPLEMDSPAMVIIAGKPKN